MNETLFTMCHFPSLPAPYDAALRAAVAFVLDQFDVLGIIASGTIIRGNPHPNSDLDLYVIHAQPQRQRLQRWFEGVPAEIFVNPPHIVETYFKAERASGRPITAHMLMTGTVILDRDPVVERLRMRAQEVFNLPPDPPAEQLVLHRYLSASRFEDAQDVAAQDPLSARLILGQAVYGMLHYRFWAANRYLPRDKDLLAALDALDSDLGALARAFYGASTLAEELALADQIADLTIQARGFFAWDSPLQDVPE